MEEQHSPEETVTDQAQSCFEELSLVEQDEEKGEKNNEKEEETQDEQKTPQGTRCTTKVALRLEVTFE